MDFINNYIVVVVLAICLCVGYIIKHAVSTDKINRYIPLIMAVLGVVINIWINGFKITPEIILGGLISGLASTGLHQAFKEIIENKKQ